MLRGRRGVAAAVLAGTTGLVTLGGCGSGKIFIPNSAAQHCPSQPAGQADHADQAELAAHLSLAVETFHRWIWRPYDQGLLERPGPHRHAARARAAAAAEQSAAELQDAISDVQQAPDLCDQLYSPVADLARALDHLGDALEHGRLGSVPELHRAMLELRVLARKKGVPVPGRPADGRLHSAGASAKMGSLALSG